MTLQPLSGLRVVEFTHFIAGPSAGQRLAELGAEVTKVEPPRGDPTRPSSTEAGRTTFEAYNRGKRSVTLNLRDPEDEAIAQTLATGADIVLHNLTSSSMKRHGLDAETLRAINPGLIYASVSGFPSNSAKADTKGFDGIGQAESGMLYINGTPESGPIKLSYTPVDTVAGDMLIQAILVAVIQRLRTGEGSEIETSLFEAGIHLQQTQWAEFLATGDNPQRIGNLEPSVAPAAEILDVADGTVIMSAYMEPHYVALCGLLGLEHLVTDPRFSTPADRLANQVELHDLIQAAITAKGWTVQEAGEAFDGINIAHGVVNTYQDIVDSGIFDDTRQLAETSRPDGSTYRALNPAYRVVGEDRPSTTTPPPALGSHNDAVRAEIRDGQWAAPAREREVVA